MKSRPQEAPTAADTDSTTKGSGGERLRGLRWTGALQSSPTPDTGHPSREVRYTISSRSLQIPPPVIAGDADTSHLDTIPASQQVIVEEPGGLSREVRAHGVQEESYLASLPPLVPGVRRSRYVDFALCLDLFPSPSSLLHLERHI